MRVAAVLCFLMLIFTFSALAAGNHPVEMGKSDCITCHSDKDVVSKPNVVTEWNQSIHSYAGVRCGNCHGDEADFTALPKKAVCEPCHSEQVANTNSPLACDRCHVAHTFNVHSKKK